MHQLQLVGCSSAGWLLPCPRSDQELQLHVFLTTIELPSHSTSNDTHCWVVDGKEYNSFSSAHTWEVLRPRAEKKHWSKVVWFKGCVPNHAFNMWIAQLNRLPTRVRLASWGLNITTLCCLCAVANETREHVLLSCVYSREIWKLILLRLDPVRNLFSSWAELLSWLRQGSSAAPRTLRSVVAQAAIFHLWRQRNNVLHNQQSVPVITLFKAIDREVRNIILGRRHRRQFHNLLSVWIR